LPKRRLLLLLQLLLPLLLLLMLHCVSPNINQPESIP
jgi:hypothetical protein